jgi:hypothetical protein
MVYNSKSDRLVLYGGKDSGSIDTWIYDCNTHIWTKMEPAENPGGLSRHAMVYSTASDRVVLFGGQDGGKQFVYKNQTWIYDLETDTWENVTPQP